MRLESVGEIKSYYEGKRNGVWLFGWWKDGIQYVGTTGSTYIQQVADINQQEAFALKALSEGKLILTD